MLLCCNGIFDGCGLCLPSDRTDLFIHDTKLYDIIAAMVDYIGGYATKHSIDRAC